jgi:hypothetical protein
MLVKLDTQKFVVACNRCARLHTHFFDRGSTKTISAPFALADDDTLEIQFDADGGNVGTVRTFKFKAKDFSDIKNITAEQLVVWFNRFVPEAVAMVDYTGVLILSKTAGPTSCVEFIGGSAQLKLGYDPRMGQCERYCCGRPVLGYQMGSRKHDNIILVRPCECGTQMSLVRQLKGKPPSMSNAFVNSLAAYLKSNGWVDPDMRDDFANENVELSATLTQFPSNGVIFSPTMATEIVLYANPS